MVVKALFLDRDGVINEDTGYVFQKERFLFRDGIFHLCQTAQCKGYVIIVVTNQSGIERGYFTEKDFLSLTNWMRTQFKEAEVDIADVFYCPTLSGPDRKPNPGLFLKAQRKYKLDLTNSLSLGDNERDVQAGRSAGVGTNVLLTTKKNVVTEAEKIIFELKEMEILL